MSLTISIDSESVNIVLPDTTIEHYKFEYAEGNNYAKGNAETISMLLTIDVMEILSLEGSPEDNHKMVQDLKDWTEYEHANKESHKEYYRKVTLNNNFDNKDIRTIILSHAYINKTMEEYNPIKGQHLITLELMQREDMLDYGD